MPRYFFHLIDDIVTRDEDGVELLDITAAHAKALQAARGLAAAQVLEGKVSLHHRIEVADVEGRPVLTLPFKDAFEIEG